MSFGITTNGGVMYNTEALKKGIEDIEKNIVVFEKAITEERTKIKAYRSMIETLKDKEHEAALVEKFKKENITMEVVRNGDKC